MQSQILIIEFCKKRAIYLKIQHSLMNMVKYPLIEWPTNSPKELLDRLRMSSKESGIAKTIAREIYRVGDEQLSHRVNMMKQRYHYRRRVLCFQAAGYRRVGSEVLYFMNPWGDYEKFNPAIDVMKIVFNVIISSVDEIERRYMGKNLTPRQEGKLAAYEADKQIRIWQEEQRKVDLLKKDPTGISLVEDFLNEIIMRNRSTPHRPLEHSLPGINAAIQRHKQLARLLTSE